jgi:two-component system response regulator PilR (NtrC family)
MLQLSHTRSEGIKIRALIVDDEKDVRHLFKDFMGDISSQITEAATLTDALLYCEGKEYDIILLDLKLEDATGDRTLQAIPEMKRKSGASIVVVTGSVDPGVLTRATNAGADFVIQKSVPFSALKKAILWAVHAAILKHPRQHPGDDYLAHVALLERLVRAA